MRKDNNSLKKFENDNFWKKVEDFFAEDKENTKSNNNVNKKMVIQNKQTKKKSNKPTHLYGSFSFIFGLISMFLVTSHQGTGVFLGILAIILFSYQLKYKNTGLAVAGLIFGIMGILMNLWMIGFMFVYGSLFGVNNLNTQLTNINSNPSIINPPSEKDEYTMLKEKFSIEVQKLGDIFQSYKNAQSDDQKKEYEKQFVIQGRITIDAIDNLLNYMDDNPDYAKEKEDLTQVKQSLIGVMEQLMYGSKNKVINATMYIERVSVQATYLAPIRVTVINTGEVDMSPKFDIYVYDYSNNIVCSGSPITTEFDVITKGQKKTGEFTLLYCNLGKDGTYTVKIDLLDENYNKLDTESTEVSVNYWGQFGIS